ncbi:MAG: phosphatidylglycerophosphatase A [Prevotella sp.]
MKKHLPFWATMIGSGFGSGFWPWGPGTMGALLATIVWLALSVSLDAVTLLIVTFSLVMVFTLLGTWATSRLVPYWGEDPSRVVVDEMVGVWIALMPCPCGHLWYALAAFVLFRFFDIVKPLGVRRLDRKKGAFWVMADDILAGIYAAIVIVLVRWAI